MFCQTAQLEAAERVASKISAGSLMPCVFVCTFKNIMAMALLEAIAAQEGQI